MPQVDGTDKTHTTTNNNSHSNNHTMFEVDGSDNIHKTNTQNGNGDLQEMPIEVCRQMYKDEINTLWREVEDFRLTCQKEVCRL